MFHFTQISRSYLKLISLSFPSHILEADLPDTSLKCGALTASTSSQQQSLKCANVEVNNSSPSTNLGLCLSRNTALALQQRRCHKNLWPEPELSAGWGFRTGNDFISCTLLLYTTLLRSASWIYLLWISVFGLSDGLNLNIKVRIFIFTVWTSEMCKKWQLQCERRPCCLPQCSLFFMTVRNMRCRLSVLTAACQMLLLFGHLGFVEAENKSVSISTSVKLQLSCFVM